MDREQTEERPPRILLIDDSLTVRKFITSQLTHSGHEVFAAADGLGGLDAFFSANDDSARSIAPVVASPDSSTSADAARAFVTSWGRLRRIVERVAMRPPGPTSSLPSRW